MSPLEEQHEKDVTSGMVDGGKKSLQAKYPYIILITFQHACLFIGDDDELLSSAGNMFLVILFSIVVL